MFLMMDFVSVVEKKKLTESISGLFMETITIRELVGMTITDGKKLIFKPERFPYFLKQLFNKVEVDDVDDDEVCDECGGEGQCDYGMGEDVKTYACEKCNPYGDEPDPDMEYDRQRDMQLEDDYQQDRD